MPRVDLAAGFPRPAHEAAPGLGLVAKCGALGAEVAVRHAAAQHVVARREHGRDAGEDRLPVAAPALTPRNRASTSKVSRRTPAHAAVTRTVLGQGAP